MTSKANEQLAILNGIASEYEDYKKDLTYISREAQDHVLRAMGYDIADDRVDDTLAALQHKRWQQVLPSVLIARQDQTLEIAINLPGQLADETLTWRIEPQQGEVLQQQFEADELAVVDHFQCQAGQYVRKDLSLRVALPPATYRFELRDGKGSKVIAGMPLVIAPPNCYEPDKIVAGGRLFGTTMQLYTLRSARNWGMGDFTDLKDFIVAAAPHGVDIVGLNPLHALFPSNPHHFSPYAPSNRAFLNVLYIDVEAIPEFAASQAARDYVADPEFQQRLALLRSTRLVAYPGVSACKFEVLELVFKQFQAADLGRGTARDVAYREFLAEQGSYLRSHATYEALYEHLFSRDMNMWGWPVWPEQYRSPDSGAVAEFAAAHADRVEFFQYLQWCAFQQLKDAHQAALDAGMKVGVYLDLAVGVDQAGSEAWANRPYFCFEASVGAPPDELALSGQDWGFPPFRPQVLEQDAYRLFARNLRASMSCSGAVRFDHAVALLRLWWIPRGHGAGQGAYVHYAIQDILGILSLESQQNRCMVIGEDLGTVPAILNVVMDENHLYSYRVLYFEKEKVNGKPVPGGGMLPPQEYPARAVASVTTHDLPTLASWWDQSDIDLRVEVGLLKETAKIHSVREQRENDKQALVKALYEQGLLAEPVIAADVPALTEELNLAVHAYLGKSRASIMIAQIEDWLGMVEPINIPGISAEYPNWQRKMSEPLEGYFDRPFVARMCAALKDIRG